MMEPDSFIARSEELRKAIHSLLETMGFYRSLDYIADGIIKIKGCFKRGKGIE